MSDRRLSKSEVRKQTISDVAIVIGILFFAWAVIRFLYAVWDFSGGSAMIGS